MSGFVLDFSVTVSWAFEDKTPLTRRRFSIP